MHLPKRFPQVKLLNYSFCVNVCYAAVSGLTTILCDARKNSFHARSENCSTLPTAYYVQAIWSYKVSIGSSDESIWRHRSDFQISTFDAHKQPQKCGGGVSGNQSSRWKFKNPLGGAICFLISN